MGYWMERARQLQQSDLTTSDISGPVADPSEQSIVTRETPSPPAPPLQPGWVVAYTDRQGRLCGGWDERATSTVKCCHGTGQALRSGAKRWPKDSPAVHPAVGQTNEEGRLLAAWTVREHGFDGMNTKT